MTCQKSHIPHMIIYWGMCKVSITLSIIIGATAGSLVGSANMLALKKLIGMIMNEGANNAVQPLLLGGTVLLLFALIFLGVFISTAFVISVAAGWTVAMIVFVIRNRLAAR